MKWIVLLLLPVLWYLNRRWREYAAFKKEEKIEEEGEKAIYRLINTVQKLPSIEYESYVGETREKAEKLEVKKDRIYERLLKRENIESDVKDLEKEYDIFLSEKRNKYEAWVELQKRIDETIHTQTEFFNSHNFYPTEYLFDINRLRQKAEDAREYQLENPLYQDVEIQQFLDEFSEKIEAFKKTHQEVTEMLPQLSAYETRLTNEQQADFLVKKQSMYSSLQQGKLDEVKKLLNDFRKKVKA